MICVFQLPLFELFLWQNASSKMLFISAVNDLRAGRLAVRWAPA